MPIGISTLCAFGQTFTNLDQLVEGTKVLEIMDEWRDSLDGERVRKLCEIKASTGILYTVHTPLIDVNIASSNEALRRASLREIIKSIHHAYEIGAELAVVHPGQSSPLDHFYPKTSWNLNRQSLEEIIAFSEELGVRVGIENLPSDSSGILKRVRDFQDLIAEGVPLKIALDVGHANTMRELGSFIGAMKDRIIHVHLHDNRGEKDQHLRIGAGTVDWGLLRREFDFHRLTGIVEAVSLADARASLEKAVQFFA